MKFISFKDILEEATQDEDTRFTTIKEVAYVMGKHEQTIYGYLNGHTNPNWDNAVKLANHFRTEYGYYKLAMQTMLSSFGGRANGKVEDDLMEIYGAGTDLNRAFKNGNKQAYDNAIAKMKAEIKDLEREGEEHL